MGIKQTIVALHNTLSQISVRGNDAKLMAACLNATEELVKNTEQLEAKVAQLEKELAEIKKAEE